MAQDCYKKISVSLLASAAPYFLTLFGFFPSTLSTKMQRGAAFQTVLWFVPTEKTCQPKRVFLTIGKRTQAMPNNENRSCPSAFTVMQWMRMWSIDSSLQLQRTHPFANTYPLFWIWSMVNTLLQLDSYAKKKTRFWRDPWIPNDGHKEGNCNWEIKLHS